jgi:anti-sigma regulatory factor (Ser/Thr protein kinase)
MNSEASLSIYAYQFSADPQIIPDVRSKFIEFLLSLGLNDTEKEGWKLTFTEAVNNAIEHGSYGLPEKIISARWWAQGNSIWLETQDEGPGPSKEQQATPRLPADPLAEGGRGLFIIHNFSDTHEHWISASGYTAQMGKHYERLNNVTAQN